MDTNMTYEKAIANANALKALGQTRVYLFDGVKIPWEIAEHCEGGCSVRLGLRTSAQFSGTKDGITFNWSFDLESRNANGTGTTRVDIDYCKAVIDRLSGTALVEFRKYLSDICVGLKKQGDEYQGYADAQYRDAAVLRALVNHP